MRLRLAQPSCSRSFDEGRKKRGMAPTLDPTSLLNRIAAWLGATLACYLTDAVPWVPSESSSTWDLIRGIAASQRQMRDRIAAEIQDRDCSVERSVFPMSFTGLHDLSLNYLAHRVLKDQQELEQRIRGLLPIVQRDPRALALVEETLGETLAQIDALSESLKLQPQ